MIAELHDGAELGFEIHGTGPNLLLPVNPAPAEEGPTAEQARAWGADPSLGYSLVQALAQHFRVIAFDYEGHVQAQPKADSLTADNLVADFLAVADAAGAESFAYYGYSWLGATGLQLAIRTDRLTALVMGGFPPIDGPYDAMLVVTRATHAEAVEADTPVEPADVVPGDWDSAAVVLNDAQTGQFVTLYESLQGFDDRAVQDRIACPRLCVVGGNDNIDYGPRWNNAHVAIAEPVLANRQELERLGWQVEILADLDHMQAMQANTVLPAITAWLLAALPTG
ncbi:alpha/beta fold hydrolase [Kribbella deserti]|uniref:Alpha/beta fold hydrolase n=1 Tax=Kribbella deserti TaxID=1926257 RepID=A0ABV6QTJ2_9ACTN